MSKYVINPGRSVLCIGHICEERYKRMISNGVLLELYKERLRYLYRSLSVERYDTYIHTAWSRFEIISAGMLQIAKPEILNDFSHKYLYSMAILEQSRPFWETTPHFNYFDDVLIPQDDTSDLTADDVFNDILSNVSVVLYDNDDHDPFVQFVLNKAHQSNMRMLDINFHHSVMPYAKKMSGTICIDC